MYSIDFFFSKYKGIYNNGLIFPFLCILVPPFPQEGRQQTSDHAAEKETLQKPNHSRLQNFGSGSYQHGRGTVCWPSRCSFSLLLFSAFGLFQNTVHLCSCYCCPLWLWLRRLLHLSDQRGKLPLINIILIFHVVFCVNFWVLDSKMFLFENLFIVSLAQKVSLKMFLYLFLM